MRAYLPISHRDLELFSNAKSHLVNQLYTTTTNFLTENIECDQEELEYLLSELAGEKALEYCLTQSAPGIILAIEMLTGQISEEFTNDGTVSIPITWDQVQCALLAYRGEDELLWFATQEIEIYLSQWK